MGARHATRGGGAREDGRGGSGGKPRRVLRVAACEGAGRCGAAAAIVPRAPRGATQRNRRAARTSSKGSSLPPLPSSRVTTRGGEMQNSYPSRRMFSTYERTATARRAWREGAKKGQKRGEKGAKKGRAALRVGANRLVPTGWCPLAGGWRRAGPQPRAAAAPQAPAAAASALARSRCSRARSRARSRCSRARDRARSGRRGAHEYAELHRAPAKHIDAFRVGHARRAHHGDVVQRLGEDACLDLLRREVLCLGVLAREGPRVGQHRHRDSRRVHL